MSNDGAHQGVMAERALGTILGGEDPPADDEGMSRQQMRDAIAAVDVDAEPQSYDQACMLTARLILDFINGDLATRRKIPTETVYDTEGDAYKHWMSTGESPEDPSVVVKERGLYDVMKDEGIDLGALGLTGFMWGWAVNAARYALNELPVPNPAIL